MLKYSFTLRIDFLVLIFQDLFDKMTGMCVSYFFFECFDMK